ncbi:hypothetical protein RF11_03776 [Thelohanellus kitauei]|uniref:Uncharacterized protein n=1 Tax=Thelohanellus kitauei TaxID=669202 RepID=A0A0C2ITX0_THEKT|nr:hypothetical protein RF11_03776 [Thelohanellus kitauei]
MSKFLNTGEQDCSKMLFVVLRMVDDSKLFEEIEFGLSQFYDITIRIYLKHVSEDRNYGKSIANLERLEEFTEKVIRELNNQRNYVDCDYKNTLNLFGFVKRFYT